MSFANLIFHIIPKTLEIRHRRFAETGTFENVKRTKILGIPSHSLETVVMHFSNKLEISVR